MSKKKFENIEAVIFDKDGVLFDSEPIQCESYIWAFSQYGYELSEVEFVLYWIIKGSSSKGLIKDKDLDIELTELREKRFDKYKKLCVDRLVIMPGVLKLLDFLKSYEIPCGVASASHKNNVIRDLSQYDLLNRFRAIVSTDEVEHSKPYPDVYLKTAEKLDVNPEHCLVIEDVSRGLRAAKAAGMYCIVTPNQLVAEHFKEDYSKADLVIPDLTKLDYSLFLPIITS